MLWTKYDPTLEWWFTGESPKENIENKMLETIGSHNEELRKLLSPQVFPSKRIRSYLLFLLVHDTMNKEKYLKISEAIELFQQSTLIFDDVIDESITREGNRITLHRRFWNTISDAGKADHIASILMLLADKKIEEVGNINLVTLFTKTKLEMFQAQLADTMVIKKPHQENSLEWLFRKVYPKTSSFIRLPFMIYALENNISNEEEALLAEAAENIGIIYQMGDDLMDIENGINGNTLTRNYPLAFLTEASQKGGIEDKDSYFINNLLEKKDFDIQDQKTLTDLFRKYKNIIILWAQEDFQILNSKIENSLKNHTFLYDKIKSLLSKTFKTHYWNYEI